MTARWRRLRKHQLKAEPLCKFCLERGIVTAANVVDRVVPHRGDWTKFVTGRLQLMRAVPSVGETANRATRLSLPTSASTAYRLIPIIPFNRAR